MAEEVLTAEQVYDVVKSRWPGEEGRILRLLGIQAPALRADLAADGGGLIGVDAPPGYTQTTLNLILQEIADDIDTRASIDVDGLVVEDSAFLAEGTGAVRRSLQEKTREVVSVFDFMTQAQKADVKARTRLVNVSAPFQSAINFCTQFKRRLMVPSGDYLLASGLSVSSGPVTIEGEESDRTRLYITANAACFRVTTAQVSIRNLAIIGEQNASKGSQSGVHIDGVNLCVLENLSITQCYDNLKISDVSFYLRFTSLRFFDCVRAGVFTEGTASAGWEAHFTDCRWIPTAGLYCMFLQNVGTLTMTACEMSPANVTEQCVLFVSRAVNAGVHLFSNVKFEGSVKESMRIEGTISQPVRYVYFDNCYFNQSGGSFDSVTLQNAEAIRFSNCYLSGFGSAVTIDGNTKNLNFAGCDIVVAGSSAAFRAISGTCLGLNITGCNYAGSQRLIDLSALSAANVDLVHVVGGQVGTNSSPVLMPSGTYNKARMTYSGTNNPLNRSGLAQFNGGVSLFAIPHGLVATPTKVSVIPQSIDAGTAEIREVTADASNVFVQCKNGAAAGTNNVRWWWAAEC